MAEKTAFSRRDFLKIIGAGAGVAAAGCGKDLPEKFIPYVVQPEEVVPGVALWYTGSCKECSAGCGTLVRVREGRAVKIEGNPNHPVNNGGLCAHGQSALQALYDPDRIREPIQRAANESFKPIAAKGEGLNAWKTGMSSLASSIAESESSGAEVVLITKPTSGSEAALIEEVAAKIKGFKHFEYELQNSDAQDLAAEKVFGPGMRTRYDLSKAQVIVNFGADFLESWLSPVRFAKQWADGRRIPAPKVKQNGHGENGHGENEHGESSHEAQHETGVQLSKVIHFEPRLSLTAGNADRWVMNAPGSERAILASLLKLVFEKSSGSRLTQSQADKVRGLVSKVNLGELLKDSGVSKDDLEKIAAELLNSKNSLVLAGGASVAGEDALDVAVLVNLLNVALGNIGKAVLLQRAKKSAKNGYQELLKLFEEIAAGQRKVKTLIISGVNLAYVLPAKSKFKEALAKVGFTAAISSHLDETASLANLVLPLSHQLESWGDSEPLPGVFSLNQPAMQPLYLSQTLGDTLIALGATAELAKLKTEGIESFHDYIKARWKARTGGLANAGGLNFESRWTAYVEKGGDWSAASDSSLSVSQIEVPAGINLTPVNQSAELLSLQVYPSVNSFDGQSANRPWMQELGNPVSTVVWGSWVEMSDKAAAGLGVKTGDIVQLSAPDGFIAAPAYVSPHVHPNLIAVPLGQGHENYGRFANGVGVNALKMLPVSSGLQTFRATGLNLRAYPQAKEKLVKLQTSDSQYGRGIARDISLLGYSDLLAKAAHGAEHEGEHEGGAHHDPLALGPQKPAKQMYRQMAHDKLLYNWGMSIDLGSCTGCSACVVACNAENNVPTVGKTICGEQREMSWIRIERYLDGPAEQPVNAFVPMMCQHCHNAPCEPVCPVYATYHTDEGLNSMSYNRCVGTRYCLNNCSYKVRRFNWYKYNWVEPLNWQLNPDVTVREVGIMEKCSFCVQRIREAQNKAKDLGRTVKDGEVQPACASSCPTKAIKFGNLNDEQSAVYAETQSPRSYKIMDAVLNTQPAVTYLARVKNV